MEEILHHLGCIKPCKSWDIYHINWCKISSINSSIAINLFRSPVRFDWMSGLGGFRDQLILILCFFNHWWCYIMWEVATLGLFVQSQKNRINATQNLESPQWCKNPTLFSEMLHTSSNPNMETKTTKSMCRRLVPVFGSTFWKTHDAFRFPRPLRRDLFNYCDPDESGNISMEEFQARMRNLSEVKCHIWSELGVCFCFLFQGKFGGWVFSPYFVHSPKEDRFSFLFQGKFGGEMFFSPYFLYTLPKKKIDFPTSGLQRSFFKMSF